ncbi:hypothetical protein CBL_00222 [Carabus blaptoides fortunei]
MHQQEPPHQPFGSLLIYIHQELLVILLPRQRHVAAGTVFAIYIKPRRHAGSNAKPNNARSPLLAPAVVMVVERTCWFQTGTGQPANRHATPRRARTPRPNSLKYPVIL